jgi:hypothetical protein
LVDWDLPLTILEHDVLWISSPSSFGSKLFLTLEIKQLYFSRKIWKKTSQVCT